MKSNNRRSESRSSLLYKLALTLFALLFSLACLHAQDSAAGGSDVESRIDSILPKNDLGREG
jgi:hypothetical protein